MEVLYLEFNILNGHNFFLGTQAVQTIFSTKNYQLQATIFLLM